MAQHIQFSALNSVNGRSFRTNNEEEALLNLECNQHWKSRGAFGEDSKSKIR